ncbi:LPS export ABC transporter permease LptG [Thiobacillus sedimenti]|uniref:LPS export ABC transporter permease LptG n=1 Tax=Thiobacillus sedimenti TaxID=3110231 RepID=A0ABZ1CLY9_9PROT|nr:LPS export ABC transporter permease LptG [Thiobacillus sp. SCUT-2]WRS39896.1 LPS export ABC transporter permease LptG [Thiobacillus sp. SCUT-2]
MRLLARYLGGQVLFASGFVLLALLVLFAFFDVIQELGSLGRNYGLAQATVVVMLNVPGHLYEILPVAVLIGTLFAMSRLAGNSEYAVMRVSGLSNWRVAGYFSVIGVLLALLVLVIGEFIAPWSEQAAQRYKLLATHSVVAQQFRTGLWVKDRNAFINVREVMPDNTLRDIEIYGFEPDGRLGWIRGAAEAHWRRDQTWDLRGVVETRFDADGIHAAHRDHEDWQSVLTPDILSVLLVAPEKMSARTLWRYVEHLRENGQKATRYELALWSKFISPFVIPIMMLIAMPFAIQGPRSGGTSGKIFVGILAGLGFHLLSRLFGHLGLLNDWPVIVVSVLPLLIFLAIALAGIRWVDRR